jgi:DNA polymerase I-like protein with 3'-5' exonuclease and polymerase domains
MTPERSLDIQFQYVTEGDAAARAVEDLRREGTLGFDTETTELDPYKGRLRLVQLSTGRSTYVFDVYKLGEDSRTSAELAPLRELLEDASVKKVAHNAKFDLKWIRYHLGCETNGVFDTFLASVLIAAGDSDRRHSLADVAKFFTDVELDKSEQVSDWNAPELSQSQLTYAARDAQVMLTLHEQMADRLAADGLTRVAELEFDCLMPIADMELNGIFLDSERWREQLEKVKAIQAVAANELQEMLAAGVAQASLFGRPEINLDSQQQVTDAMINLGIPMPNSTRAWELQPLAEKYPVVGKLLEYRAVQKSMTSFGENTLEFVEPATGRVHADFRQIGAPTGRFSCSNPNLQQIPHEAAYRRCFRSPEGRKLVIADYSQIELRILADFSGDDNFIKAFESGQDFHAMTASQVFNTPIDEVTADQRSFAKRLNFGIVYGVGASRFGLLTGLSQSDAEDTMRKYFGTYRKLDEYLRNAGRSVVDDRVARTASGRLLRIRYDDGDRASIGAARRYGVNMPIQGTSADILKRCLRLLHDALRGTSGKLVNIVHDEVMVECDASEADSIATKLDAAMVAAGRDFVSRVPIKTDVHIADEWSKA